MTNALPATALQPLLFTIITPLYRILDDKQVTDDQMSMCLIIPREQVLILYCFSYLANTGARGSRLASGEDGYKRLFQRIQRGPAIGP